MSEKKRSKAPEYSVNAHEQTDQASWRTERVMEEIPPIQQFCIKQTRAFPFPNIFFYAWSHLTFLFQFSIKCMEPYCELEPPTQPHTLCCGLLEIATSNCLVTDSERLRAARVPGPALTRWELKSREKWGFSRPAAPHSSRPPGHPVWTPNELSALGTEHSTRRTRALLPNNN